MPGRDDVAVGGDDFAGKQVVAGEAVGAHQVAEPAAEGQSANAGGRDSAAGRGQTVGGGCGVEVAPGGAALGTGSLPSGIDTTTAHAGEVDHQTVIADRQSGDIVPTAADRDRQILLGGEADAATTSAVLARLDDQGRRAVDHRVPDRAGGVEPVFIIKEYTPGNLTTESF